MRAPLRADRGIAGFRRAAFLALVLAAGVAIGTVPLPYYALGPGPARDVLPLIQVSGAERDPSTGALLLTAVSVRQVTGIELLLGWLDPDVEVEPAGEVVPAGTTFEAERERAVSQMDTSKLDAAAAALRFLTRYPRDHGDGVLVRAVVPGCAAEGELYAGDRIVAIDGEAVASVRDVARILDGRASGATIAFDLRVDGAPETARLVREPCGGSEDPIVGVSLLNAFPIDVTIASGGIGGPSAGLMFALGICELLGDDDLAAGRTIAGTGEIDADGVVYAIGGVAQKIAAAEDAGVTIFLVPRDNLAEARATGTGLRLVPVDDLGDAVAALAQPVG